jgi:hypothetical protein
MTDHNARFELRAFATDLGIVEAAIRELGEPSGYRESLEVYIMSAGSDEHNTKVRGDLMDIKELVTRERDLEQWRPRMKGAFPLARETLREQVFPAFGVTPPELLRDRYNLEQYLSEVIGPHPSLSAVSVFKQRWGYAVDGCIAEFAKVYVNGALLRTACLEDTDAQLVLRTRERVHLQPFDNVNYLVAIKRVIGMTPLPERAFYRAF